MERQNRYPKIYIQSKNDLAKRLSSERLSVASAKVLINDVLNNYDSYWHDNLKKSKPDDGKYVRSAYGTQLGKLLKLIDKNILATHDELLPEFIFGGVSGRDHVKAARSLLGKRRGRIKLGLDIKRFFEQNKEDRVVYFLYSKCSCSMKAARLIAKLCCIPNGAKGSGQSQRTLARGFATSTRLATWVNLELFLRVHWLVKKRLKGHDSRLAIFVDDIGVTASGISKEVIDVLSDEIAILLSTHDSNQKLLLNNDKKNIQTTTAGDMEHLGLQLGRNKVGIGRKTAKKRARVSRMISQTGEGSKRKKLIASRKSYKNYDRYIGKINKQG